MTDATTLISRLLDDLPTTRHAWNEYEASPDYPAGLPFVLMGHLALVMVRDLTPGHPEAAAILDAVERELPDADRENRSLLVVGLLESIQNVTLNEGGVLGSWEPLLGTVTTRHWQTLKDLWSGRATPDQFNASL